MKNAMFLLWGSFATALASGKTQIASPVERDLVRKLNDLQCPISPFEGERFRDDDELYNSHRFAMYSTGDLGRNFVKTIRGKSLNYYQDIINDIIMTFCDDSATDRCVENTSPFAAKDWKGECIVASDQMCPSKKCERTSNCYWASVSNGESRFTRFTASKYEEANKRLYGLQNHSYLSSVGIFGLVGISVALMLFLMWALFFVGRYCCCCLWTSCSICFLCSPIPKKQGYRICGDLAIPILLYIIGLLGISVAAALAFIGNEDISVASTNLFLHSSGLTEDLGDFLIRSRTPLINIDNIVQDAALDAKNIFDDTAYVSDTATFIMDSFADFGILHGEGLEASNARQYFDVAYTSFNERVSPIVTEVQRMLDTLKDDLYQNVDIIQTSIISAIAQTDSIMNVTNEYKNKIYEIEGQELGLRQMRKAAVMGLFLVSLAFAIVGFLGIILSKITGKRIFLSFLNIAGFTNAFLGCISLILASVFLSMNILWYDTCEMSKIVITDFEPYLGDKVAPGANACFNDTNLAVAL